ncbi:hypothetical protein ACF0H5_008371 [Mactra antiquata]
MDPSEWKKPSEVMKNLRRRKSVSQRRITTDTDKRTSVIYKSPSKPVKRKNPFHKDSPHPFPAKRQNVCSSAKNSGDSGDPLSCQLFTLLEKTENGEEVISDSQKAAEVLKQKQYDNLKSYEAKNTSAPSVEVKTSAPPVSETSTINQTSQYLPIDWSLKTKLRIVSASPLNWCSQIRSTDESHGVTQFVQDSTEKSKENWEKRLFQCTCMYWIHPNIPWMKLFPRIIDDTKSSSVASYLLQDDVQKPLQADWEQSFTSAYYQLRSGLCPYFYLCTHQFTVLFYNKSETQSDIVGLVTPTTRGFRELLENEGIEFKLPVCKKSSPDKKENVYSSNITSESVESTDDQKQKVDDNDDDVDDILDNDDAAHGWLESMGLDKKQFPTLDPRKVKLQREGFRVIDHRPESLVYIDGSNIQALYNFLLNCRSCVAMSGTQAGLPPTILSPKPFKGATLKSHKVKHTVVKQQSDKDSNITHAHIVEISGPILPSHCQRLVSLLHHTQNADFGMVFNNHDTTIPFNILGKLCGEMPEELNESDSSDIVGDDDTDISDLNCEKKTMLEAIDNAHSVRNVKNSNKNSGGDSDLSSTGEAWKLKGFYKSVPIADDRICGIKEVVCTKEGFSWTT